VISILKSGKDPMLPSSYRPISLLDTAGKLFEEILLTRVLTEVNERGLLCDEQFVFRHRYSTRCSWPALLKESTETMMRGDRPAPFSWMWPKPSTLHGSKSSSTSSLSSSLHAPKRPSNQPHPHVIQCGLVCPGRTRLSFAVQSVCERHANALTLGQFSAVRG
jgi:hypothetical protein